MFNTATKSIFFLFILCASKSILISSDAENIFNRKAESVVKITTFNQLNRVIKRGSGVVLGKSKSKLKYDLSSEVNPERSKFVNSNIEGNDIISTFHVIAFASKIIVESKSGKKSEAGIVYFNSENDIAILRTANEISEASCPIASKLNVGEKVFAIGNPSGLGWSISDGILSGFRTNNESEVIQFTAPISAGSSGGGLFNSDGNLIGIITSQIRDAQNLNFAINLVFQSNFENEIVRKGQIILPQEIEYDDWATGYFYLNVKDIDLKYSRENNKKYILWQKYKNTQYLLTDFFVNRSKFEKITPQINYEFGREVSKEEFEDILGKANYFLALDQSTYFENDIKSKHSSKSDEERISQYNELKKIYGEVLCLEDEFLFARARIYRRNRQDADRFENEIIEMIKFMPARPPNLGTSDIYWFCLNLKNCARMYDMSKLDSFLISKGYE